MNGVAAMHISGSREPRPAAARVAYCDGGIDAAWREGADVELSHWIPNRTPAAVKASTSTEICLRFAEAGAIDGIGLAVNNHVDTDGMLSVFVLRQPELALANREVLVQAAAAGDFGAWGTPTALHLHQLMALARRRSEASGTDPLDIYRQVHGLVERALAGERFDDALAGVGALDRAADRVDRGVVVRTPVTGRLTRFVLDGRHREARGWISRLDDPGDALSLLPASVRSRHDAERVHLVSARHTGGGWFHDLFYPGYAWAETVGLWRPPGLKEGGSSNRHRLQHPALEAAASALAEQETARGRWLVAQELTPFEALAGRGFPVVLSFVDGDQAAPSALSPDEVAEQLAQAFVGG